MHGINLWKSCVDINYVGWPVFWLVKDDCIIVTRGKTGTRTLIEICDYSCLDTWLTFDEFSCMICNKGYRLLLLIRDPYDRFRSGLLEEWSINRSKIIKDIVDNEFDWGAEVIEFTNTMIDLLNSSVPRSNFHTGNWLEDVETLVELFPKKTSIHTFDEFPDIVHNLGKGSDLIANQSIEKPFYREFTHAFDDMPNSLRQKIHSFLYNEVQVWNKINNT